LLHVQFLYAACNLLKPATLRMRHVHAPANLQPQHRARAGCDAEESSDAPRADQVIVVFYSGPKTGVLRGTLSKQPCPDASFPAVCECFYYCADGACADEASASSLVRMALGGCVTAYSISTGVLMRALSASSPSDAPCSFVSVESTVLTGVR
jgi:hypothetical protein